MTLKDENAAVKAVMFRAYASKLGLNPENGMVRQSESLAYEKTAAFRFI